MADLTAQNKWEPLATDNSDREKIWSKSRTFAGDVWFRFRRKPTAIAGFVIIIALMLFALVGPLFTHMITPCRIWKLSTFRRS